MLLEPYVSTVNSTQKKKKYMSNTIIVARTSNNFLCTIHSQQDRLVGLPGGGELNRITASPLYIMFRILKFLVLS